LQETEAQFTKYLNIGPEIIVRSIAVCHKLCTFSTYDIVWFIFELS